VSEDGARERDAYQDALVNAGKSPVIMLPVDVDSEGKAAAGWGYELVQADGASAVEVFERGIRYCDSAAAMAILRQTLTMEPAPIGSHALGKVHNAVRHEGKRADTEGLATTGHFQVLRPWALFNYGDERAAPWPKWDARTPEERQAEAEAKAAEARRRADVAKAEAEARRAAAEAAKAEAAAEAEAARLRAERINVFAAAAGALGLGPLAGRVAWDELAKDVGVPLKAEVKARRRALSGSEKKTLHVVDGTYELFRAHHSKGRRRVVDGQDVKATVGMVSSLVGLLETGEVTHFAVAFDNPIESFRNKLFEGYKDDTIVPPALRAQFDGAEKAARALGAVVWSMSEYEADDALATACELYAGDFEEIRLLSPDKDLAQCLTRPGIVLVDRARKRELTSDGVRERFGVPAESIPDFLALVGDAADHIPGIDGVGIEAASALLSVYGKLEDIPTDPAEWTLEIRGKEKIAAALVARREDALLFRKLAVLVRDVPLEETAAALAWTGPGDEFALWCEGMGVPRLAKRLEV
jgi:5'-3' exonuclease